MRISALVARPRDSTPHQRHCDDHAQHEIHGIGREQRNHARLKQRGWQADQRMRRNQHVERA